MKKGLIFAFIVVAVTVIISCFGVGLNMESAFAGNVLSENESSRNNGRGMAVYEQAIETTPQTLRVQAVRQANFEIGLGQRRAKNLSAVV